MQTQGLGIYGLPYTEKDDKGNETYIEHSDGSWERHFYDEKNNPTYSEFSIPIDISTISP